MKKKNYFLKLLKNYWRIAKKYYFKILRSNGSPHSVAMAIFLGLFIGCFIPIGGQTVIVIILAIIFRTDKVLAFAATWISNPYTVIFLYPIFCYVGSSVLGQGLTFGKINSSIIQTMGTLSWNSLLSLTSELAVAYFVGGAIFGVIFGLIGYYTTYKIVIKYRNKKRQNMIAKREKYRKI